MKKRELIEQLSARMGVEETSFRTADAALTRAGLTKKSQGRYPADVTTEDALKLVLAVMGAPQLTEADSYVREVIAFEMPKNRGGFNRLAGEVDNISVALGMDPEELESLPLLEALVRISRFRAETNPPRNDGQIAARWGGDLWLRVEVGGTVELLVQHGDFTGEAWFIGAFTIVQRTDGRRIFELGDRTIAWIGHVTKDAA